MPSMPHRWLRSPTVRPKPMALPLDSRPPPGFWPYGLTMAAMMSCPIRQAVALECGTRRHQRSLPASTPQLATVLPWTLDSPEQFRASGPPKLTSKRWARDYNEVKSLGRATDSARTPEQTGIGLFWADHPHVAVESGVARHRHRPGPLARRECPLLCAAGYGAVLTPVSPVGIRSIFITSGGQ